jgi:putative N6-adenine-specific DNA methylase
MLVPCLLGLEGLVADELRRLSMAEVKAENGRVFFSGSFTDLARANVGLRCGARVLLVLAEFPAKSFEDLFQGVLAVPWEAYIPQNGAFPVRGYSIDSLLHAVPACQSVLKKAVVERLRAAYGPGTLPEDGTRCEIRFSIFKDVVTVGLDSSGEGLYKRGYRAVNTGAPLRETLAAAMVLLSKYRGRDPFCDPFCGSGTIPIEAALIAKNRAPGLGRGFAAQKWAFVPAAAWMDAAEEAMDREFDGAYDIWGGDIDPHAVEVARQNAEKAGVETLVRFGVADAARFGRTEPYGRVVTNPPYGERMLEKREAEALYAAFGAAAAARPRGWRVSVLSPHRVRARLRQARGQKAQALQRHDQVRPLPVRKGIDAPRRDSRPCKIQGFKNDMG